MPQHFLPTHLQFRWRSRHWNRCPQKSDEGRTTERKYPLHTRAEIFRKVTIFVFRRRSSKSCSRVFKVHFCETFNSFLHSIDYSGVAGSESELTQKQDVSSSNEEEAWIPQKVPPWSQIFRVLRRRKLYFLSSMSCLSSINTLFHLIVGFFLNFDIYAFARRV